jgi:hypothetical protein
MLLVASDHHPFISLMDDCRARSYSPHLILDTHFPSHDLGYRKPISAVAVQLYEHLIVEVITVSLRWSGIWSAGEKMDCVAFNAGATFSLVKPTVIIHLYVRKECLSGLT